MATAKTDATAIFDCKNVTARNTIATYLGKIAGDVTMDEASTLSPVRLTRCQALSTPPLMG